MYLSGLWGTHTEEREVGQSTGRCDLIIHRGQSHRLHVGSEGLASLAQRGRTSKDWVGGLAQWPLVVAVSVTGPFMHWLACLLLAVVGI